MEEQILLIVFGSHVDKIVSINGEPILLDVSDDEVYKETATRFLKDKLDIENKYWSKSCVISHPDKVVNCLAAITMKSKIESRKFEFVEIEKININFRWLVYLAKHYFESQMNSCVIKYER